ncbi:hypothetical protein [Asticcacaulis excentricus]|uniref:Uncharacterized protein n=1 Tax=Asticcacaulis excentricus (strain ATCC 15261 / DSM 4724 / KCTC 12464 / NCIMB 9791 / VKM B-1370 / CB 48) TaxID=573065 RepID=E8RNB1_ASTEC|nr:hypothetical protein [Asticcacaulis excentricus]ADU14010.1 hypothetical protein Astex_2357 [Asticcacaulis excentricus CB 48]
MDGFLLVSDPGEQLGIAFLVMSLVFVVHSIKRFQVKSRLSFELENGRIARSDYELALLNLSHGARRRWVAYVVVAIVITMATLFGNGLGDLFLNLSSF